MGADNLLKPALYAPGDAGGTPVLRGGKCACGGVFFPMQSYGCDFCGRDGSHLQPFDLKGEGELVAAAVVHLHPPSPKGPQRTPPFVIGSVRLSDGPVVRTLLTCDAAPDPGTRLVASLEPVENDGAMALDLRFAVAS